MTLPQKIPESILHTLMMPPAIVRTEKHGIPISTPVVHIFLNRLHTNHTKFDSNVIDQLFKSRCAVCSPNMKVSFVRGDLLIVPDSATPEQSIFLSRKLHGKWKALHLSKVYRKSGCSWCPLK